MLLWPYCTYKTSSKHSQKGGRGTIHIWGASIDHLFVPALGCVGWVVRITLLMVGIRFEMKKTCPLFGLLFSLQVTF